MGIYYPSAKLSRIKGGTDPEGKNHAGRPSHEFDLENIWFPHEFIELLVDRSILLKINFRSGYN